MFNRVAIHSAFSQTPSETSWKNRTQEVANLLGITANGVKKGRQRLRKRLEISPEEDLEQFVKVFLLKGK